jgi:hypothetical protein
MPLDNNKFGAGLTTLTEQLTALQERLNTERTVRQTEHDNKQEEEKEDDKEEAPHEQKEEGKDNKEDHPGEERKEGAVAMAEIKMGFPGPDEKVGPQLEDVKRAEHRPVTEPEVRTASTIKGLRVLALSKRSLFNFPP